MATQPAPLSEKELAARIISDLLQIPDELQKAEATQARLQVELSTWKANAKDAETDAMINAPGGKNDDERKKNAAQAIMASPAVKQARNKVGELEAAISAAEVDTSYMRHRWQGAIALAELQAARLNAMSKIQTATTLAK